TDIRFHAYTRDVMKQYFVEANEDSPDCFVIDCNGNLLSDDEDITVYQPAVVDRMIVEIGPVPEVEGSKTEDRVAGLYSAVFS
ncbi:MAG: hypothetical protein MK133_06700, partial [Planctomycetes bacterium]|nr:hypothetical protein [Planctomycetota bacterium]